MEVDISEESKKALNVLASECTASEMAIGNGPTCISSVLPNPLPDMPDIQFDPLPPPPPPPLLFTWSGRPQREYRLPKRFHDNHPEPPAPVPTTPHSEPNPPVCRVILIVCDHLITFINSFGIWHDYPQCSSVDPDSLLNPDDLSTAHCPNNLASHVMSSDTQAFNSSKPYYWPFLNATVYGVMQWLNNGHTVKSEVETTKLIRDVILSLNFDPANLVGFDAHWENQRLDEVLLQSTLQSQFIESSVDILLPSGETHTKGRTFRIPGLLHQKLTSVIQEAFESPLAHLYHYSLFKIFHKSPLSGKDKRIYSETFTSDAFLDETEQVQWHAPVPPEDSACKQEKVVAAMMFSSDATMLTDFSTTKGWPIYFMLGNLSKYIWAQPDSGAMHHLAYIPSVSHLSSTAFNIVSNTNLSSRRLDKILDDDFLHAYTYGIVIKCIDGIERHIHPRLFTYSADYPEKQVIFNELMCHYELTLASRQDSFGHNTRQRIVSKSIVSYPNVTYRADTDHIRLASVSDAFG